MSDTESLQAILDIQGFIVVGSTRPKAVGEVIEEFGHFSKELIKAPVVVIAAATYDDFRQQSVNFDPDPVFPRKRETCGYLYFYKVIAE